MTQTSTFTKFKTTGLWCVTILLAGFFLMAGVPKLQGASQTVQHFSGWGYPLWMMYVVGVIEVVGAVGLLIPRVAGMFALTLGMTMVGAATTHFLHDEFHAVPIPLVLLALLSVVGCARWGNLRNSSFQQVDPPKS